MESRALGSLFILISTLACSNGSNPKSALPIDCSAQGDCAGEAVSDPGFKIWSPSAQAILLEKLAGPYTKADLVPGLFLERKEMTEAQVEALDKWAVLPESDVLKCSADASDVAYKAVIFDEEGGKQVYYGANNACGEAGQGAQYVPISYFQNFPGDIPYRPNAAGDYVIEKVRIERNILKVDVKYSDGCAFFRNFTLMVDVKVSDSSPSVINGYIRHRTDNECEALGRSRLEFDLSQYDFHSAELLKLKGWTRPQALPVQKT
jgi:hypothetical protein